LFKLLKNSLAISTFVRSSFVGVASNANDNQERNDKTDAAQVSVFKMNAV